MPVSVRRPDLVRRHLARTASALEGAETGVTKTEARSAATGADPERDTWSSSRSLSISCLLFTDRFTKCQSAVIPIPAPGFEPDHAAVGFLPQATRLSIWRVRPHSQVVFAFASGAGFALPSAVSEDCLSPPSALAFAEKTISPTVTRQITNARIPASCTVHTAQLEVTQHEPNEPSRCWVSIAGLTASCVHFEVRVSPQLLDADQRGTQAQGRPFFRSTVFATLPRIDDL